MTMIQYIHIAFEIWGAIFCIIAAICAYASKVRERRATWAMIAVLLIDCAINIFDALAYYYRGNETSVGYVMVRVSNFMVFAGGILLVAAAYTYIIRIIDNRIVTREKWSDKYCYGICAFAIVMLIMSNVFGIYYSFDVHNRYYRLDTYWISVALNELEMLVMVYVTIRYKKVFKKLEFIALMTMEFLPMAAVVCQILFYGISLFNIADTVSIIFLVVVHEIEYSSDMVKRERMIAQERIRLYNNQIQPHFIYNSLTAIRSYLPSGSKAREVLNHFTKFLRGSLDMLNETDCIDVGREFATVDSYLYMAQERLGDNLSIKKEIGDTDFLLPPFTVQLLVENAIKHGIRGRDDAKGTVTIKSYETKSEHVIEVSDDGVGFDVDRLDEIVRDAEAEDHHTHLGIQNSRERLRLMCDGYLEIKSQLGEGTNAIVHIPKTGGHPKPQRDAATETD